VSSFSPTLIALYPEPAKILLVDDHPFVRQGFVNLFREYPIEIDTAATASYALSLAYAKKYSLYVVDFHLGDSKEDGIWFFRQTRSRKETRDTPALMMTMEDPAIWEDRLIALGFSGVFQKNLAGVHLKAVVSRLLFPQALIEEIRSRD
jgi:DNA-binding NarL/FixJ family response regulator